MGWTCRGCCFSWAVLPEAALNLQVDGEAVCWRKAAACKIDSGEVHRLLEGKASVAHVKEALAQKADRRVVRSLQGAQQEGAAMADKIILVEDELHRKAAMQVRTSCCVMWCQGHGHHPAGGVEPSWCCSGVTYDGYLISRHLEVGWAAGHAIAVLF